ncbi:hypothetical protein AH03_6 [Erwinia phage AH03]|uniref:Uncharacterized protein n=1 Tax=Erwinia phage AH03 TaxID=2869568 RepID=A0AAE8BPY4_9CAUD|nr:hypothetical protein AH03_6 [Erwinia phage AH03]
MSKILCLTQAVVISKQDHMSCGGWSDETAFESVWIVSDKIESFAQCGLTHIKTTSGELIKVKESASVIVEMMNGEQP